MSGGTAQRIENGVDASASLLLAGAVLFSASTVGLPILLATGWAVLAFLLAFWLLGSIGSRKNCFSLSAFIPPAIQANPPELQLDDVSDSRVVRLFDSPAASQAAPPDDSQALYDALIDLRRKFIQQS